MVMAYALLALLFAICLPTSEANARNYKEKGWYMYLLDAETKQGERMFDLDPNIPGKETKVEKFVRKNNFIIMRLSANGYIYGFLVDLDPETNIWRYQYLDADGDGRLEWEYKDEVSVMPDGIPDWVQKKQPKQVYFLGCRGPGDPYCKTKNKNPVSPDKSEEKEKPEHFSAELDPSLVETPPYTPPPLPDGDCEPEGLFGAPPEDCLDPQIKPVVKPAQWVGEGRCRRDESKSALEAGGFTGHDARVCQDYAEKVALKECGDYHNPDGQIDWNKYYCRERVIKRVWGKE